MESIGIRKKNLKILNPSKLYDPKPYGFSHMAVVNTEKLVLVSGQGGEDAAGNLTRDFRHQVQQAFENIEIALTASGLEMKDIAKLTTLIVDFDESKHQILIEESKKIWKDEVYPAHTLIPVNRLALDPMLFEVEAIAVGQN